MASRYWILLLLMLYCSSIRCDEVCSHDNTDTCQTAQNKYVLHRISTTGIGQTQIITLDSKQYTLKTLSLQPLAFEIVDYLTDEECDEIIRVAQQIGLKQSVTRRNKATRGYQIFDIDRNDHLDLDEMRITLEQNHDVNMDDADIIEMYQVLGVDLNNDHKLSKHELHQFHPGMLADYIEYTLLRNTPWKHSRLSEQAWLYYPEDYTPILTDIHHRLYDLFSLYGIPTYIANDSFTLQVVHYGENGKYNAHYDSSFREQGKDLKCCFRQNDEEKRQQLPCKSCRFMTVLYYLNDVEQGGDTVFPLSNPQSLQKRFNAAEVMDQSDLDDMEKYDPLKWRMSAQNLPQVYCDEETENLRVAAKKGKALIWFNHLLDENTQWIGDSDIYAMHTGCPVKTGEKWIANHWIQVNDEAPLEVE